MPSQAPHGQALWLQAPHSTGVTRGLPTPQRLQGPTSRVFSGGPGSLSCHPSSRSSCGRKLGVVGGAPVPLGPVQRGPRWQGSPRGRGGGRVRAGVVPEEAAGHRGVRRSQCLGRSLCGVVQDVVRAWWGLGAATQLAGRPCGRAEGLGSPGPEGLGLRPMPLPGRRATCRRVQGGGQARKCPGVGAVGPGAEAGHSRRGTVAGDRAAVPGAQAALQLGLEGGQVQAAALRSDLGGWRAPFSWPARICPPRAPRPGRRQHGLAQSLGLR